MLEKLLKATRRRGDGRAGRRLGAVLFAGLFSVLAVAQAEAQVRQIVIDDGTVSRIELAPGHTLTVETDSDFADILIGNPNILDVFPLTNRSLYVQARANGTTNVTLYSEDKKLLEVIDIRVRLDFSEVSKAIQTAVPSAQVSVSNVNDRIRLTGEVKDNVDMARIVQIAQQFSGEAVINAIKVRSAQQVELDVRILEVSRNSGRALGIELDGTHSSGSTFATGASGGGTLNGAPFGNFIGTLLSVSGLQVDIVINALEAKGLGRRLANPKLVTTSGVEANFVVGGEVPIAVTRTDDNGNVASGTEYREYGIKLNFLPTVLDDQLIRLRVSPEVTDVDASTTAIAGGVAFISRKAETTVSLRNGQSFAIAGLLSANNSRNTEQIPWLGQIPILGTLFSSRGFQKRETDLVILVTPRLVQPVSPGTPLASPLDDTRSSNDVELFLLGMMEVDRQLLRRFREGHGVVGPYGHMIDLEFDDGILVKK